MEQQVDLTALDRQPDPETFRRVWARVMPREEDCPIALDPALLVSAQEEPALVPVERGNSGPDQAGEERVLEALMALSWESLGAGRNLVRRTGSGEMAVLAADHRRALERLAAAYFLATGQRRKERREEGRKSGEKPLAQALREQFLREGEWIRVCMERVQREPESSFQQMYWQLARQGQRHQRAIQEAVERLERRGWVT